jgi:hypothetical protein
LVAKFFPKDGIGRNGLVVGRKEFEKFCFVDLARHFDC